MVPNLFVLSLLTLDPNYSTLSLLPPPLTLSLSLPLSSLSLSLPLSLSLSPFLSLSLSRTGMDECVFVYSAKTCYTNGILILIFHLPSSLLSLLQTVCDKCNQHPNPG